MGPRGLHGGEGPVGDTGPEGQQGQQGSSGPPGPQGIPSGPGGLTGSNVGLLMGMGLTTNATFAALVVLFQRRVAVAQGCRVLLQALAAALVALLVSCCRCCRRRGRPAFIEDSGEEGLVDNGLGDGPAQAELQGLPALGPQQHLQGLPVQQPQAVGFMNVELHAEQ